MAPWTGPPCARRGPKRQSGDTPRDGPDLPPRPGCVAPHGQPPGPSRRCPPPCRGCARRPGRGSAGARCVGQVVAKVADGAAAEGQALDAGTDRTERLLQQGKGIRQGEAGPGGAPDLGLEAVGDQHRARVGSQDVESPLVTIGPTAVEEHRPGVPEQRLKECGAVWPVRKVLRKGHVHVIRRSSAARLATAAAGAQSAMPAPGASTDSNNPSKGT
jgi:hypothetical protein